MQSRYLDNFDDISTEKARRSLDIAIKFEIYILPLFG
jgi:hypothetical protein